MFRIRIFLSANPEAVFSSMLIRIQFVPSKWKIYLWITDACPDLALSVDFKMPRKIKFFFTVFFAYCLPYVHCISLQRKQIIQKSQYWRKQGFSEYFWLLMGGSGAGAGPVQIIMIQIWEAKNLRIRFRNTASLPLPRLFKRASLDLKGSHIWYRKIWRTLQLSST